jgi:hypothetical protein
MADQITRAAVHVPTAMREARMRDDRVFGGTRVLGAVIVPFLLVAFVLLYFFPDDTRHWFA